MYHSINSPLALMFDESDCTGGCDRQVFSRVCVDESCEKSSSCHLSLMTSLADHEDEQRCKNSDVSDDSWVISYAVNR